jgi:hypothetical protein
MTFLTTLGNDVLNSTQDGFDFPFPGPDQVNILNGVTIASAQADGVHSTNNSNNVLLNGGIIIGGIGVVFDGAIDDSVTNQSTGVIMGTFAVEMLASGSQSFNNSGQVIGIVQGIHFASQTTRDFLINHGTIAGGEDAIDIESRLVGGVINNSNLIERAGLKNLNRMVSGTSA